ncbi:MAG TPA: hypothetical protein VKE40_06965, partial [Gemmataceae bacterium]|nr:hypothetical protein [Gemmataceae bacterium]
DGPGEGDHFASVTEGLRGHKARHNLAVMYLEMHREAEAEVEWQKALEEEPLFLSAQAGMGEVYLRLKRWDELEDRARRMEALGREGELHAEALRGRAHLERGEAAAARWGLGRACERFPDSLTLRVLHSHAALKEGLDREAEAALLAVLDLAPSHAEARQNLAVLRARRRLKPGEEITLAGLFAASCARDDDAAGPLTALRDLARGCQRVVQFGAGAGEVTTALLMGRPGELVCCDRARAPELDLLEALAGKTKFEFRLADQRLDDEMDLLVVSDPTLASIRRVLERSVTTALRLVIVHGPNDVDHSDSGLVAAGFRPAGGGRPVAGLSVWERNGSRG